MAFTFTGQQTKVLEARNHNILVSAAAGSGKTAVLVERIVRMISEGDHPLNIDRLLVVTFTKAAAAQMRERIGAAIVRKLEEDPGSVHLQKQETLLHNAQITTIDSFFTFVLRNNFSDIDLDPGFRQMDQTEADLMRKDTLEDFLEEGYETGDPSLLTCEAFFCRGDSDRELENIIQTLYAQAVSRPDPVEWIRQRAADYDIKSEKELYEAPWMQFAILSIADQILDLQRRYARINDLCMMPAGPSPYLPAVREEMDSLCILSAVPGTDAAGSLSAEEISEIRSRISRVLNMSFGRLPAVTARKNPEVDPDLKDRAASLRNSVKKKLGDIKKRYSETDPSQILSNMAELKDAAAALSDLTERFLDRFRQVKREKNVIDFIDLEHFALEILTEKSQDGTYVPRRAALSYRRYFDEILIDEYQDSNDIQELLLRMISTEDEGRCNRFMVGDVKQSIYKFRLARPEIFMHKLDVYRESDPEKERIDLDSNFRSRKEVLSSVNDVFFRLMRREVGGVEYDHTVSLKAGADYPPSSDPDLYKTELILVDGAYEEGTVPEEILRLSKVRREALAAAGRIRELVGTLPVRSADGGQRPCRFGDIVVLLRTGKGWCEEFREIFEAEGIPYYIESRTGYFAAKEIQTVLGLISVLDNPRQDIPLYGALKGFFGGFSEDEIARIRIAGPDRESDLFTCLAHLAGSDPLPENCRPQDIVLRDKCRNFLQFLEKWRKRTVYLTIRDLLTQLFGETGYEEWCRALPGGEQRNANLQMLMAQAASFDSMGVQGLFDFVRYIDQMHHREVDYGEANILDENADVVRIMSIHKSKGLEFPVCIVAGTAKPHSFNAHETKGALVCDSDWGIGMDRWIPSMRARLRDFRREAIADKIRMESLGEELRVLYVAMTRAEEKLILTGYLENTQEQCAAWEESVPENMAPEEKLPVSSLTASKNDLELIWCAMCAGGSDHIRTIRRSLADLSMDETVIQSSMAVRKEALEGYAAAGGPPLPDHDLENVLRTIYSRRYAYENLRGLFTKTSVSELKMAALEEEGEGAVSLFPENLPSPVIPDFAGASSGGAKEFSGTEYGTAVHKLLELFDYRRFPVPASVTNAQFDDWREEMCMSARIPRAYKDKLPADGILRFLKSDLARRMAEADAEDRLFREQPFVIGIPADSVNPDFPHSETVLIQGIIDACFIEDGEMILVDYKTDRVSHPGDLIDRYHVQMELYERALSQITERKVREKLIYSLSLGKIVKL